MARLNIELQVDDREGWADWGWPVAHDIPGVFTLIHYDIDASRYLVCGRVIRGVSVIYRTRTPLHRPYNVEWREGLSEPIATLWRYGQSRELTIRNARGEERVYRFTHRSH